MYSYVTIEMHISLYEEECRELRLIKYNDNKNPTYQEVINFLIKDQTDMLRYIPNNFICNDFNAMVHNNAQYAGFNCQLGFIEDLDRECGHTCVIWDTSDYGRIFTDSTGDICPNLDFITYDKVLYDICYGKIGKYREIDTNYIDSLDFIIGNIVSF
jgi:hypothetical protein